MGCIMYTMLVGKPPFETSSLKDTYSRIKRNEYVIPEDKVGPSASDLITSMLHPVPIERPSIEAIVTSDFITVGYMPKRLPPSALTVVPHLTAEQMSFSTSRRPLVEVQKDEPAMPPPKARPNFRKKSQKNLEKPRTKPFLDFTNSNTQIPRQC